MMLLRVAWRNIWRNTRRSMIILISVTVGIVASVLTDALDRGMVFQMLDNQIGSHISHIQIHRAGFNDNPVIQSTLPQGVDVDSIVGRVAGIEHFTRRVITFGILSSAASSSGVSIVGIEPGRESLITTIKSSIVQGSYLSGKPREIIIATKLAEKLGVGLGDKVVAMASALDGHIGSDVFRIVGLFETFSSEFDKAFVYIPLGDAQQLVSIGDRVSEIAIIAYNRDELQQIQGTLRSELGNAFEVLSYAEILPLLIMTVEMYNQLMIIFYVIIGVAVIFGIINTMLMSVFERIREFGVLKAIGMKNRTLFAMIMVEAFYLGAIGTAAGFVLSLALYVPLAHSGLDLSMFSDSLRSFGVGAVIYPVMTVGVVANALTVIPAVAILGAIYPAFKAVRLEPMSAIRYV
jgi:putative ABC transport system permease protein